MCKSDLKAVTKLARERGVSLVRGDRSTDGRDKARRFGVDRAVAGRGRCGCWEWGLCVSQEFCDEVDREYARFKQELCEEHGLTWDQGNE